MISRRPKLGQSPGVIEDGVVHREPVIPGETSYRPDSIYEREREVQGETQGRTMRCEVADESVVVMKSRPMKAGNRLEGKTGTTRGDVTRGPAFAKSGVGCEGRKFIRRSIGN